MGRPATTLSEVNYLVSTLTLTPHARPLVATACALARRIDAAEGTTSGRCPPGRARTRSGAVRRARRHRHHLHRWRSRPAARLPEQR